MNSRESVDRLRAAFRQTDYYGRGCIGRDEFIKILLVNGGLQHQIDVLVDQFATSSNPQWLDYVSFMEYLEDIAAETTGKPSSLSPPTSRGVSESISPVPRPAPPSRTPFQSLAFAQNQHPSTKQVSSADFVERVVSNVVTLRAASRSSSAERSEAPAKEETSRPVLRADAPTSTSEAACSLGAVFEVLDVDVDGFVTVDDVSIGFSIHNVGVTKLELDALLESMDIDPLTGRLDKSAFCVLVSRLRPATIEKIRTPSTWHGAIKPTAPSSRSNSNSDHKEHRPQSAPQKPVTEVVTRASFAPLPAPDPSRIIIDAFHPARWSTSKPATHAAPTTPAVVPAESRFMKPTQSAAARARTAKTQEAVHEPKPTSALRHSAPKPTTSKVSSSRKSDGEGVPRVRITLPNGFEAAKPCSDPPSRASSVPSNLESLAEAPTPAGHQESSGGIEVKDVAQRHFASGCGQLLALCNKMDRSGQGVLPAAQVRAIAATVCPNITPAELDALIPSTPTCAVTDLVAKIIEATTTDAAPTVPANSKPTGQHVQQLELQQRPTSSKVGDVSASLKALLRDELLSVCEGDFQLLLEQFVSRDVRRSTKEESRYLPLKKFQQSITAAYKSVKVTAPDWVVQRATKIARTPFAISAADGSDERLREAIGTARRFLRMQNSHNEAETESWCDFRYLLDMLR